MEKKIEPKPAKVDSCIVVYNSHTKQKSTITAEEWKHLQKVPHLKRVKE